MDPNATLHIIDSAGRIRERDCQQALKDLASWLRAGGCQPDWHLLPLGTQRFKKYYSHLVKPRFGSMGRSLYANGMLVARMAHKDRDAHGELDTEQCAGLATHIASLLNRFPPRGV